METVGVFIVEHITEIAGGIVFLAGVYYTIKDNSSKITGLTEVVEVMDNDLVVVHRDLAVVKGTIHTLTEVHNLKIEHLQKSMDGLADMIKLVTITPKS